MLIRTLGLLIIVIVAGLGVIFKLKNPQMPEATISPVEEVSVHKEKKQNVRRVPSSTALKPPTPLQESPAFVNKESQDDRVRESIDDNSKSPQQPSYSVSSGATLAEPPSPKKEKPPSAAPNEKSSPNGNNTQQITSSSQLLFENVDMVANKNVFDNVPLPDSRVGNREEGGSNSVDTITCSADVGSGSYSYAFNVTLTCTAASSIQYCLSEDVCCDPETSGTTYTAPVLVNPGSGTYCLSFVGTSTINGIISRVVDKSYTLNPALPDLLVSHVKTFYQSTELEGVMGITSLDFGVQGMYAGVVNLKDNDPGPSGLGLSCEDILNDHATLGSNYVMADTNVAGFSSSSQFDIFLKTTNLSYGNNYLTSYVQNATFAEPVISCATNNIVLEDFEYFDSTPYHGVPGTNDVREFSGGFTHVGFFEPAATVYRGPAGSASETVSDQELDSNLFGIFY